MEIKNLEETIDVKTYNPDTDEKILQTFVQKRKDQMQDFRVSLGIEKEWKEADIEYVPHELEFGTPRKRFETDQDTGLRSRMVPIGDQTQNWRSNASAPTLLVKIQTAFSIIIDNNPEAVFTALQKKYDSTSDLVNSLWKRNWQITDGKEVLKLFVFDMLKYGWGIGRSYPKKISYKKEVLTEYDSENPEKNKYETKEITWFNDVMRERLSPYKTWIDEQTKPYDVYSTNDCYYEMDFSYDQATIEFGNYKNWEFVKPDSRVTNTDNGIASTPATPEQDMNLSERDDIVTIGFYENRAKDLYVIWVPKDKIVLHKCPLPNDDGMLSVWHAPWILRSSDSPYGVSVWKIIKQDKELYDKYNNMTADQLVLSIMKFGFHTGTSGVLGDGVINIVPGQSKQITNGKFDWMEIPGPGKDSWEGLQYQKDAMDKNSGITPTIEGDLTGKTLGEIQLAREASLKRLKVPLDNIAWALEQDAFLTISWMGQVYSTPEVKQFANEREMLAYEKENDIQHDQLFAETDPNTLVKTDPMTGQPIPPGEEGQPTPPQKDQSGNPIPAQANPLTATYLPKLSLHLEDKNGQLYQSEESRYFQVGKDIPVTSMKWKGMIKVIPKSLVGTSEVIIKQTKQEMANLIIPLLSGSPLINKKVVIQLLKINEEDPQEWLPDIAGWNDEPYQIIPPRPSDPTVRFTIGWDDLAADPEMKAQIAQKIGIILPPPEPNLFVPHGQSSSSTGGLPVGGAPADHSGNGQHTMQNTTGNTPQHATTVVPNAQVSSPSLKSSVGGAAMFNK